MQRLFVYCSLIDAIDHQVNEAVKRGRAGHVTCGAVDHVGGTKMSMGVSELVSWCLEPGQPATKDYIRAE